MSYVILLNKKREKRKVKTMIMTVNKKDIDRSKKVYRRKDGTYLVTCGVDADWCFSLPSDIRVYKKDLPKQFTADVYDDWDV